MKEFTQIADYKVEIWRRPLQRTLKLTWRAEGHVRVTCGKRVPLREIKQFVEGSREFIRARIREQELRRQMHPPRTFVSGEKFLFLGQPWELHVFWTWAQRATVTLRENHIEMRAPLKSSVEERQAALLRFYRQQARWHLTERLEHFSKTVGLKPRLLSIRGQTTRWGSCSGSGEISLNWKLMATPPRVIDYVIVHELCHLLHMNHSDQFWRLVAENHPTWAEDLKWLKQHHDEIAEQFVVTQR